MWKPMIFMLSVLCWLVPCAGAADRQGAEQALYMGKPFELHRFTLDNGLRVWCQPRSDSTSVFATVVVRAGARDESAHNKGIAHFVEHLLFTGTQQWDEDDITDIIEERGGVWNGWAGTEQSGYYAHMPADDSATALEWLSQIVFHPTFPADKIDRERGVIIEELGGNYTWLNRAVEALGLGYDLDLAIYKAIFPDSHFALDAFDEIKNINRISRRELLEFYRRYYVPANAALIVVGNCDPAQVHAMAEQYFGSVPAGPRPPEPAAPREPDRGPHRMIVRGPGLTAQGSVAVGARTVGSDHPDSWPLLVLSMLLADELHEEIRTRRGLVYSVSAWNHEWPDAGYFEIYAASDSSNRAEIVQVIDEHLENIRQGRIDLKKLNTARAALKGAWALGLESNAERAHILANLIFTLADDEVLPDEMPFLDAVLPQDLQRVARKYFSPDRRYYAAYVPIVTVAGALYLLGAFALLAVSAWGLRRCRLRTRPFSSGLEKNGKVTGEK